MSQSIFDAYLLDRAAKILLLNGQRVSLTKRQFETLSLLLDANGETISCESFLEIVWAGTIVEDSNLTQTVFMLRRALGLTPDGMEYIETVPRKGYRLSSSAQVLLRHSEVSCPSSFSDTAASYKDASGRGSNILGLLVGWGHRLLTGNKTASSLQKLGSPDQQINHWPDAGQRPLKDHSYSETTPKGSNLYVGASVQKAKSQAAYDLQRKRAS